MVSILEEEEERLDLPENKGMEGNPFRGVEVQAGEVEKTKKEGAAEKELG